MKRIILAVAGILVGLATFSHAAPNEGQLVGGVFRNDGNSSIPFAVTCASDSWTVLGSSVASNVAATSTSAIALRRRSLTVQTLGTVSNTVCISTGGASAVPCGDSTKGYELGTPWAAVSIYNEEIYYCRTRSVGTTLMKGVDFYDNRDRVVE